MIEVIHGDCLKVMAEMADSSVDSIVTDPPYGLSFMGKNWDHGIPGEAFWREALRVAKPGAHLLAFGGTRTFHRLAVAIEDAGWEIRDTVGWIYGSGFPKSHNLKGEWQGWGTALKPAWEPVIVARKPFKGTVAENVLKHGTGGLNIDGCRVPTNGEDLSVEREPRPLDTQAAGWGFKSVSRGNQGRWPANLIHDGSEEVVGLFPQQKSPAPYARSTDDPAEYRCLTGTIRKKGDIVPGFGDSGSAARFFYCAKASRKDRDEGLEHLEQRYVARDNGFSDKLSDTKLPRANTHPTVKPTDLMAYLCRLVTPPGGTVLDPFCGSGSTGKAAIREGFNFIGIEKEAEYVEIAKARIEHAQAQPKLML